MTRTHHEQIQVVTTPPQSSGPLCALATKPPPQLASWCTAPHVQLGPAMFRSTFWDPGMPGPHADSVRERCRETHLLTKLHEHITDSPKGASRNGTRVESPPRASGAREGAPLEHGRPACSTPSCGAGSCRTPGRPSSSSGSRPCPWAFVLVSLHLLATVVEVFCPSHGDGEPRACYKHGAVARAASWRLQRRVRQAWRDRLSQQREVTTTQGNLGWWWCWWCWWCWF